MAEGGAAVVIPDPELAADSLRIAVAGLLADEERLGRMAASSRALAKPEAAARIAAEVLAAAEGAGGGSR
jgi:UDP-N-acetylglucosamine--N-acetylmuramyl-(pentapeptide) pyrophosphoryl-undecaprenol N-acetylglucosamine transferase